MARKLSNKDALEQLAQEHTPGFFGKQNNDAYKYKKMCLGFDQSYSNTGIALVGLLKDGSGHEVIHCESVPGKLGNNTKAAYRMALRERIRVILKNYRALGDELFAVCESVRVYTEGHSSITNHLMWGALMGTISDYLWDYQGITLRMAETRAWKSSVVGSSKPATKPPPGVDARKWPTIQYMLYFEELPKEKLMLERPPRARSYTWVQDGKKYTYNDNIADACCIAIYGLTTPLTKLKIAP